MKLVKTIEAEEIPNPHFNSARALQVVETAQFEPLILDPGQEQKKHIACTNAHVLEGTGMLEEGGEADPLSADLLMELPSAYPSAAASSWPRPGDAA